jgi:EAL domain-containing protein (putative c-di-GMP-specific phosphodiesterase class I)
LRKAVDDQRWELHYQPLYDLATRRPAAVEALIRWREPDGRLVGPNDFIGLAEEMGLIQVIGEWVVQDLCRQLSAWREQGLAIEASFNLSPRQLWNPQVTQNALVALRENGLDPRAITIEINESAVMTEANTVNRALGSLHDLGVRLAIDDFGTGYSSLSRLKDLPVDIVKIDRSFVSELSASTNARRIVEAMIRLIDSLGLVAVAEGIETEEQLRFLHAHGCSFGQGFLFSRPVEAARIPQLFEAGTSQLSIRQQLLRRTVQGRYSRH